VNCASVPSTLLESGSALEAPVRQDLLQTIRVEAERLNRLVQNLLEMTRLEAGVEVRKEWHSIEEVVGAALSRLETVMRDRPVHTDIAKELPLVPMDDVLVEQVLINLLENACKFTPRGGAIEIRGWPCRWDGRSRHSTPDEQWLDHSEADNAYRLDIRDSGPPIPPSHLESIFEEYTSYNGGQDRSGGGLGLAICRMIISLHNGSVWAENTIDGPQFSFVLPVRLAEAGSHLDQVDTIPKHIGNL